MIQVLIVEDSPTLQALMVHFLEADPEIKVAGCAESGTEAVKKARQLKPDLITMDVVMPDMDGLEATRRIMRDNPIPIIIVTAHTDSDDLNVVFEAMKAGALDVMTKPDNFGTESADDWQSDLLSRIKQLACIDLGPIER